jgi:hypothetical protein
VTKPARTVVVALSDTHAGHKLALMRPGVQLLDNSGPKPSTWKPALTQMQRTVLWPHYKACIKGVSELANGAPIVLIHTGDLTWGTKYAQGLVSTRIADQLLIAVDNLEQWYALPNLQQVILIEGTDSHELGEATAPVMVASELTRRCPKVGTRCAPHALVDCGGRRLDMTHHGPGAGRRVWLSGDELRRYVRNIVLDELLHGCEPPDVVMRAHIHDYLKETVPVGGREYLGIVSPSFCGLTPFARQVMRSPGRLTVGLVALEISDGKVAGVHPFVKTVDLRQVVKA